MKKLLLFLCVISLLAVLPAAAADEQVYTEGYFYYTVSDQSITIVGYFGNEAIVTVPASIAGIPVNAVGPNAFAGTSVQILYLPDTIRELGENATGTADVRFIGQPTPEPQAAESPEHHDTGTQTPTGTATAAPTGAGEEIGGAEPPAEAGTNPPSVTEQPTETAPSGSEHNETPAPAAEAADPSASGEPVTTAEPEAASAPEATVKPAEQPKNLTWLWITLGAAAAAGGTAAGVAAAKKTKRE
jgi:hypothetical protein